MFYQAVESFIANVGGAPVTVSKGELVEDSHELYLRFPSRFRVAQPQHESQTIVAEPPLVEAATAAPGEKRGAKESG